MLVSHVFFLISSLMLAYQCALTAGLNRAIASWDHAMLVQGVRHNVLTAGYDLVLQNFMSEKKNQC